MTIDFFFTGKILTSWNPNCDCPTYSREIDKALTGHPAL